MAPAPPLKIAAMSGGPSGRRRLLPGLTVLAVAVVGALLVALAGGWGVARTFVVDAETRWARLHFAGDTNAWPITGATVCTPLPAPAPMAGRGTGPCDARLFAEGVAAGDPIVWGPDGIAEVTLDGADALAIRVIRAGSYPAGTRVILPAEAWQRLGALSWLGQVEIGRPAASGETGLMLGGSYEAREVLRWLPAEMRTTEVVKTGTLRRGESVALLQARAPAEAAAPASAPLTDPGSPPADATVGAYVPATGFGHLTPGEHPAGSFRIVALSPAGDTALRVDFTGAERALLIRPNWIDRLTASPLLAALATGLAVTVALANLLSASSRALRRLRWRRRRAAAPATAAPAAADPVPDAPLTDPATPPTPAPDRSG